MLLYFIILIIVLLVLLFIFHTIQSLNNCVVCDSNEEIYKINENEFIIEPRFAFTKSLRHDENLICNKQDFNEYIDCLTHEKLNMKYFGNMKMVSISSSFNNEYNHLFDGIVLPHEHNLLSNLDNDMIELYAMSLCRDIPFKHYDSNQMIMNISKELNQSIDLLFRATDDTGFYISQFIYYPHKFMGNTIEQKYKQYIEGKDYGVDEEYVIDLQNGFVNDKQELETIQRYVRNGRDLSKYVHQDNPLVYGQIIYSIL